MKNAKLVRDKDVFVNLCKVRSDNVSHLGRIHQFRFFVHGFNAVSACKDNSFWPKYALLTHKSNKKNIFFY